MRIIGGVLGGRRLRGLPRGSATRPSSERLRAGLFSALAARDLLSGRRVLDLFAGSGALGFEALSRGASDLVAVDRAPQAVRCVRNNARELGLAARVRVLQLDLFPAAQQQKLAQRVGGEVGLVLCDPPYEFADRAVELVAALHALGVLEPGGHVAFEHPADAPCAAPAPFEEIARYRYGSSAVALWVGS